mmetsp:Transcript_17011/g.29747  ORF Transcript_17011/g.29747 Transcript_17011/m.29747 type:complete len:208 (+) Transcript_17011:994-1617(+)|eukprot:CAMPEP_0184692432 /NCGR_PEP_ID=MMETSP0313-20130426/915_1 /TAXON_ID=2792 /ORGANISM="Porphyridium aerugineum, Strain SAG 1380-2" /LENGTH=207 /DNA_ID=CAMNT_0027150265 /DNA_START=287 /DNA_END=910 /DNA_ORIENTATION=-
MAFVSGFSAGFKSASVKKNVSVKPSNMVMMAMSKSVPFLEVPKNCVGLPASSEFDPLFLSNYIPVKYLQESEIKHGRICMLAAVGILVQEQYTFGGSYFPKMLPYEAHAFYLKTGGMAQILLFIAAFESLSFYAIKQMLDGGDRKPGQFFFDPLGLGKDPKAFEKFQANEVRNGRLAMLGVAGLLHNEFINHTTAFETLQHFKVLGQ